MIKIFISISWWCVVRIVFSVILYIIRLSLYSFIEYPHKRLPVPTHLRLFTHIQQTAFIPKYLFSLVLLLFSFQPSFLSPWSHLSAKKIIKLIKNIWKRIKHCVFDESIVFLYLWKQFFSIKCCLSLILYCYFYFHALLSDSNLFLIYFF